MVALPLLFAFLIILMDTLGVRKPLIKVVFLLGALLPAGVLLRGIPASEVVGGWNRVSGIEVGINEVNLPFIVGELILFGFTAPYALSYFDFREKKTPKALALLLLLHAGLLGAFIAKDLFNFYIYMEIASVSAFALITFSDDPNSRRAAFKYLILSLLASYLFIFAIGVIYMETGYLNLALISANALPSRELNAAVGIAIASLLLKAGIFPLHSWLPDAHSSAPTPVSAILSGAVVKAPAYGLILVFSALPIGRTLRIAAMGVAVASLFFGIGMALLQRDAKRLLAYHTVSQMGYVLLGIASLNFVGAAYYALAHSLFKGGLFLSVGGLARRTRELGKFGYRNAPIMALSTIMLSLAIGGISPFVGSYAKGLISSELSGTWKYAVYLGGIGTLLSFTKLNYSLSRASSEDVKTVWKAVSMSLALVTLGMGLYLGSWIDLTDALYLASALALFVLLKSLGVFKNGINVRPKEVGEEINVLVALFVLAVLAVVLLQGA
ncbi:proton-conducting transporter membrane subunit [Thermococcus sp. CX2]|uniref:proton-conducting transporter transmembrane domain-containing protein n=1 Tax=Thermococcus sp. CX2 TaxID=163006 RepID=UPI00197D9569|nr:proton-conducting transporter membrane subunit [Thermococcus sp. CX2]